MRQLGIYAAVALLCSAGSAFALTATLGGGGTILVPYDTGGSYDLAVDLTRSGGDPGVTGVLMDFVADAPGISIVGVVGNAGTTGTGTRYNSAEWDSNTASGTALSPNAFSGPMPANTARGPYGTGHNTFSWRTASSNLGVLRVTIGPGQLNGVIHLTPVNVTAFNEDYNEFGGDAVGMTFSYTPEPASALLLLGALPLVRRRRTADLNS